MYCPACGTLNDDNNFRCIQCGNVLQGAAPQPGYAAPQQPGYGAQQPPMGAVAFPGQKSRMVAGLLQIFLGSFGVGRFYLGYTGLGVAQLIVTWITCGIGGLWPFIDGIMILTGNPSTDANGNPLGQ
ncbi:MAG: TM2 domain-containing protein [Myxococcota bacterium]|nr:TM2 domain-containing protein [Myxococcota bacterium]